MERMTLTQNIYYIVIRSAQVSLFQPKIKLGKRFKEKNRVNSNLKGILGHVIYQAYGNFANEFLS